MKTKLIAILSVLAALSFPSVCFATNDATCLVYQPIDMRGESSVIRLPKEGFIILPIPYLSGFSVAEKPYDAIALPYKMLSMRHPEGFPDSNLISRAGITIRSICIFEGKKLKQELITVDLSGFCGYEYDPSLKVTAEAALECIRRTATDERQNWIRPVLKIVGKAGEEAAWKRWEDAFNKQDFSKPFKRPLAPAAPATK